MITRLALPAVLALTCLFTLLGVHLDTVLKIGW